MPQHHDIEGHYKVLGVSSTASEDDIRSSFRKLAKKYHPDVSKEKNAKDMFQRVNEAYKILSDTKERARYDALRPVEEGQQQSAQSSRRPAPQKQERYDPIVCECCGIVTAQPRYVIFWKVSSFVVHIRRHPIEGIFCRSCADAKAVYASFSTWFLGWWGLPHGPVYTIEAIIRNLLGGTMPPDANARLLWRQASAFVQRGEIALAKATLDQGLKFVRNPADKKGMQMLQHDLGNYRKKIRLVNKWNLLGGKGFYLQLMPFFMLIGGGVFYLLARKFHLFL